jgi:quercetin dioxygenase-like cupin family protein
MAPRIAVQRVRVPGDQPGGTSLTRVALLPGAIAGVETNYYIQGAVSKHTVPSWPGKGQVVVFIAGAGEVRVGHRAYQLAEMASLCAPGDPLVIESASAPVEYLEILVDLRDQEAARPRRVEPFFIRHSQCEAYAEAIKSPRTVSRTIVPAETVPRFCMGSVEAVGPDEVGAHTHPMLEQLFFGLPGNRCVVSADEDAVTLEERALLHVPLGSRHGVRVAEGHRLHYIWMDFFRSEEEMTYIHEQHRPIEK